MSENVENVAPVVEKVAETLTTEQAFARVEVIGKKKMELKKEQDELKKRVDAVDEEMVAVISQVESASPFLAELLRERITKKPGRPKGSGKSKDDVETTEYEDVEV